MKNNTIHRAGHRLKLLREHLAITQSQAGEHLGMKDYQFRDLESGKVELSTSMAKLIHHELGASVEWLLSGEGSMMSQGSACEEQSQYGTEVDTLISKIKRIYQHCSEDQKSLLYGHVCRVYDRILNERGAHGDSGEINQPKRPEEKKTNDPPAGYQIHKKPA